MADIIKVLPEDLDPNKEYVVRVRSINGLGNPSNWSEGLYIDTGQVSTGAGYITQSKSDFSILNDDGELVFGAFSVQAQRFNLVNNPSFELDTVGWDPLSLSTISRVATQSFYGSYAARVTPTTEGTEGIGITLDTADYISVSEFSSYTAAAYIYRDYDSGEHGNVSEENSYIELVVNLYNNSNSLIGAVSPSRSIQVPNNAWTRVFIENIVIPSDVARLGLTIRYKAGQPITMTSNEHLYVDGVLVEESNEVNSYFDGSTIEGTTSWTGAPHSSPSEFENATSSTVFIKDALAIGGVLESTNYDGPDGPEIYSDDGTRINLADGSFISKNFVIDSLGNVFIREGITIGGYIPEGGAAADINNNSTTIDGSSIESGTITGNEIAANTTLTVGTDTETIEIVGGVTAEGTYIRGGSASYGTGTGFYMDASGRFSLGTALTYDNGVLTIGGSPGGSEYVPIGGAAADVNAGSTKIEGDNIVTGTLHADRIVANTIEAVHIKSGGLDNPNLFAPGVIEADALASDAFKSLNYDEPEGGDTFADLGLFIDLSNGSLTSKAMVIDNITGTVEIANLVLDGISAGGTIRIDEGQDVSLVSTGHPFQVGADISVNLALDGNEIQVRNAGSASTLYLNNAGGVVEVGSGGVDSAGPVYGSRFQANSTVAVSAGETDHGLTIGSIAGAHLAADTNTIQAFNGVSTATLQINQFGGDIIMGGNIDAQGNLSLNFSPTLDEHAVRKDFLDDAFSAHVNPVGNPHPQYLRSADLGNYLLSTGDTMSGTLSMDGNVLEMEEGYIALRGLANNERLYVDTSDANKVVLKTLNTGELRTASGGEAVQLSWDATTGVTVPNNLTVSGDLIIDGSSISFNTDDINFEQSTLTVGGGSPPAADDGEDKGLEFRYYDTQARTGFVGWDNSSENFVLLLNTAKNSGSISGTRGTLDAYVNWSNILLKPSPVITLSGDATGSVTLSNLNSGTLAVQVQNDSHTHDIRYYEKSQVTSFDADVLNQAQSFALGLMNNVQDNLDDHITALDPHPQYLTPSEGNAAYDALGSAAAVQANLTSHLVDTTAAHAATAISFTDIGFTYVNASTVHNAIFDLDQALESHELDLDPHPQYLTPTEGDTAYVNVVGDTMTGNLYGPEFSLVGGGNYRTFNSSSDPDISALLIGTSGGDIIQGPANSHFVVDLRNNGSNDAFVITSRSTNTHDDPADTVAFRVNSSGVGYFDGRVTADGGANTGEVIVYSQDNWALGTGDITGRLDVTGDTYIVGDLDVQGTVASDGLLLSTGDMIQWGSDSFIRYYVSTGSFTFYDGTSTLLDLRSLSATFDVPVIVPDAVDDNQALNRATGDGRYVNVSGDTMTGLFILDDTGLQLGASNAYEVSLGTNGPNTINKATATSHGMQTAWSSGGDRWVFAPIISGVVDWGKEFQFNYNIEQWHMETPLRVADSVSDTDAITQGQVNDLILAIDTDVTNHVSDSTDAHDASAISYDNSGLNALTRAWLSGDNVQTALTQLGAQIEAPDQTTIDAILTALNQYSGGNPIDNSDVFQTGVILSDAIASGQIIASKIAANVINASHIEANSFTGNEFNAESVIRIGNTGQIVLQGTDDPLTTSISARGTNPLRAYDEWVEANSWGMILPLDGNFTDRTDVTAERIQGPGVWFPGTVGAGGENNLSAVRPYAPNADLYVQFTIGPLGDPGGSEASIFGDRNGNTCGLWVRFHDVNDGIVIAKGDGTALYQPTSLHNVPQEVFTQETMWRITAPTTGDPTALYSLDNGTTWTDLGAGGWSSTFPSTTYTGSVNFGIGSGNDGNDRPMKGYLRHLSIAEVGSESTPVFELNAATDIIDAAATSFRATTGQTVTVTRGTNNDGLAVTTLIPEGTYNWVDSSPIVLQNDWSEGFFTEIVIPNVPFSRRGLATSTDINGGNPLDGNNANISLAFVLYIPEDYEGIGFQGFYSDGGQSLGGGGIYMDGFTLVAARWDGTPIVHSRVEYTLPGPGIYTVGYKCELGIGGEHAIYLNGVKRASTLHTIAPICVSGGMRFGKYQGQGGVDGDTGGAAYSLGGGVVIAEFAGVLEAQSDNWYSEYYRTLFKGFGTGDGFHVDASGRFSVGTSLSWDGNRYLDVGKGFRWDDRTGKLTIGAATAENPLEDFNGVWEARLGDDTSIPNSGTAGSGLDATNNGLVRVEGPAVWFPNDASNFLAIGNSEFPGNEPWTEYQDVRCGVVLTPETPGGTVPEFNSGFIAKDGGGGDRGWYFSMNVNGALTTLTTSDSQANANFQQSANSILPSEYWGVPILLRMNFVRSRNTYIWSVKPTTLATHDADIVSDADWIELEETDSLANPVTTGSTGSTVQFRFGRAGGTGSGGHTYLGHQVDFDGETVYRMLLADVTAALPDTTNFRASTGQIIFVERSTTGPVTTLVPEGTVVYVNPDDTIAGNEITSPDDPSYDIAEDEDAVLILVAQEGNAYAASASLLAAVGFTSSTDTLSFYRSTNTTAWSGKVSDGASSYETSAVVGFDTKHDVTVFAVVLNRNIDEVTVYHYNADGLLSTQTAAATPGAIGPGVGFRAMRNVAGVFYSGAFNKGVRIAPSETELGEIAKYLLNKPYLGAGSSIESNNFYRASGNVFSTVGTKIDLATGAFQSPQLSINDTTGSAQFAGQLVAPSGDIGGWDIAEDKLASGHIEIDSANDLIKIGSGSNHWLIEGGESGDTSIIRSKNATALNSGSGVWITAGADPNFRVGDPTGDFIRYSGGDLTISGQIAATTGEVGGWDIGVTTLESINDSLILDSGNNSILMSQGSNSITLDASYTGGVGTYPAILLEGGGAHDLLLWSASAQSGIKSTGVTSYKTGVGFRFDSDGEVHIGQSGGDVIYFDTVDGLRIYTDNFSIDESGNVTIAGEITAESGSIGGISIDTNKIYAGVGTYGNSNTGFYLGQNGDFSLGDKLAWNATTETLTIGGIGSSNIATDSDISDALSTAATDAQSKADAAEAAAKLYANDIGAPYGGWGVAALGPSVATVSGAYNWAAAEGPLTLLVNGVVQLDEVVQGSTGTISLSAGDIVEATAAVGLVTNATFRPVPLAYTGRKLAYAANRNFPDTLHLYAVGEAAEIEVRQDDPDKVTPDWTLSLSANTAGAVALTGQSTGEVYITSTGNIVGNKAGSGGDYMMLLPPSREIIAFQTNGGAANFGVNEIGSGYTGSNPYYIGNTETDIFTITGIGDGSGGDAELSIPVTALGDTYYVPHGLGGYNLATIFPTVIDAYYWDDVADEWVLYNTHDFLDATRENPRQTLVGSNSGGGAIDGGTLWKFVGTNRFAVRTNTTSSDEYIVVGFVRALRHLAVTSAEVKKYTADTAIVTGNAAAADAQTKANAAQAAAEAVADAAQLAADAAAVLAATKITGPEVDAAITTIDGGLIQTGTVDTNRLNASEIRAAILAVSKIVAGDIFAGTITAEEIAAGAITTEKLSVTSPAANLNIDPSFRAMPIGFVLTGYNESDGYQRFSGTQSTWRAEVIADTGSPSGDRVLRFNPDQAVPSEMIISARQFPAEEGRTYRFSAWVKLRHAAASITLGVSRDNRDRNFGTWLDDIGLTDFDTHTGTTDWTYLEGIYKPLPGETYLSPTIRFSPNGNSDHQADISWWDFAEVKESVDIQDGAITADKVDARAITAEKLEVSSLGRRLIENGQFQQLGRNLSETWVLTEGGLGTGGFSIVDDSANGNETTWSLLLNRTDDSFAVGSRAIAVVPGVEYVLRARLRVPTAETTGSAYIRVQESTTELANLSLPFITHSGSPYGQARNSFQEMTIVGDPSPFEKSLIASDSEYFYIEDRYTPPAGVVSISLAVYNWSAGDLYVAELDMVHAHAGITIEDGTITTDKLAANSVTANEIAAGAITANKLAIAPDGINLVLDGSFEGEEVWIYPSGDGIVSHDSTHAYNGQKSLKFESSSGGSVAQGFLFPCEEGETLVITHWAYGPSVTTGNCRNRFYFYDEDKIGASPTFINARSMGASLAQWTYFEGEVVVPAGAKWARPALHLYNGVDAPVYFDDLRVFRKIRTVQIEDGAITADKIAANSIEASKIIVSSQQAIANLALPAAATDAQIKADAAQTAAESTAAADATSKADAAESISLARLRAAVKAQPSLTEDFGNDSTNYSLGGATVVTDGTAKVGANHIHVIDRTTNPYPGISISHNMQLGRTYRFKAYVRAPDGITVQVYVRREFGTHPNHSWDAKTTTFTGDGEWQIFQKDYVVPETMPANVDLAVQPRWWIQNNSAYTAGVHFDVDGVTIEDVTEALAAEAVADAAQLAADAAAVLAATKITGPEVDAAITTIDGGLIQTGTVDTNRLNASEIRAAILAVNTIQAGEIFTTNLSAISSNLGSITAGDISIGSGNDIFKVASDGDMWVGHSTQSVAPFRLNKDGSVTMTQATITGYVPVGGSSADITTISGNKVRTGSLESNNYSYSSGDYSNTGTSIDLDNGVIRSKQFGIDSSGNALFKGSVTGSTIVGGQIDIGGSDSSSFHVDTSGNHWSGAGSYGSAPFRVSNQGALVATNADISGQISASSGDIGGWNVGATSFYSDNNEIVFNATTETVTVGSSAGEQVRLDGAGTGSIRLGNAVTGGFNAGGVYIDADSGDGRMSIGNGDFVYDGSTLQLGGDLTYTFATNTLEIDGGTLIAGSIQADSINVIPTGANLLLGGNMEGTTPEWYPDRGNNHIYSFTTSEYHTGGQSLSFTRSNGTNNSLTSRKFPISPSTEYVFRGWIKSDDTAGGTMYVRFAWSDNDPGTPGVFNSNRDGFVGLSLENEDLSNYTSWTYVERKITTPATARWGSITVLNWSNPGGTTIFMDDFQFTEVVTGISLADGSVTGDTINAESSITIGTNGTYQIHLEGASSQSGTKLYGGNNNGVWNNGTGFYMDATGDFSLGGGLSWDAGAQTLDIGANFSYNANTSTLSIDGTSISDGTISTEKIQTNAIETSLLSLDALSSTTFTWNGTDIFSSAGTRFILDDLQNPGDIVSEQFRIDGGQAFFSGVVSETAYIGNSSNGWSITSTTINSSTANAIVLDAANDRIRIGTGSSRIGLDYAASTADRKIYIGNGNYGAADTGFYADASGRFSLKTALTFDGTDLALTGDISGSQISGGELQIGTGVPIIIEGTAIPSTTTLRLGAVGVYFDGTFGNYISTSDKAALDITGDIALVANIRLEDYTAGGNVTVISKWDSIGGNQRGYMMRVLADGTIQFFWSTDGVSNTSATSTTSILDVVSDGEAVWIGSALDVSSGDVKFWTSYDGDTWTQLGSTIAGAGATSIFANTYLLKVNTRNTNNTEGFTGSVYDARVYNGIGAFTSPTLGTKVAHWVGAGDGYNDGLGNTWDLTGSAWTWAPDGGAGIYMDASGRFSISDKLTFAGTTLEILDGILQSSGYTGVTDGSVFSTVGTNINLGNNSITSENFRIDTSGAVEFQGDITGGTISIGSGSNIFGADSNGIWLGATTYAGASSKFRVSAAGALQATNTTISGDITATSGTFNGTVNAESFALKAGAATRGTWTTNASVNIYGNYDGIVVDTASGNVTAGLVWKTNGGGNDIRLQNYYASGNHYYNSVETSYNYAGMQSKEVLAGFKFSYATCYPTGYAELIGSDYVNVGNDDNPTRMGEWVTSNNWNQSVAGTNGYLLLGALGGDALYLRTSSSSDPLRMGTNGITQLTVQSNALTVSSSSFAGTLTGISNGATMRYGAFGIFHFLTSNEYKKENITEVDYDYTLDILDQLRPVNFIDRYLDEEQEEDPEAKEWREKAKRWGFIAEEIWEIDEGHLAVIDSKQAMEDDTLVPISWDEAAITTVAIASAKALRVKVEALEVENLAKDARINSLESQLLALIERVNALEV